MSAERLSDYDYELPEELIAKYPAPKRSGSRLLHVPTAGQPLAHHGMTDLPALLLPGDLMIFNDTQVFPARFSGKKATGGQVACLVERVLSAHRALVHIKSSRAPKPGAVLEFSEATASVVERQGSLFVLEFTLAGTLFDWLERVGDIPLPPYIDRETEALDQARYQTTYAREKGAVAAPTAGLHFDKELLSAITARGVETAFLTLHVGAGTFQPIRGDDIASHTMHSEYCVVPESVCAAVAACQARGGRVIAVGTTTLRALEAASQGGRLLPYAGETDLFIAPGYAFQVVDQLVTNFHLPKSTLLLLVAAFCGYETMKLAYATAVAESYRFYSYGDAMLVARQ